MPGETLWLTGGTGIAWAEFDPIWYLARYQDVRPFVTEDDPEAVLQYYLLTGQRIGHSPNRYFDEAWYRQRYPEVAASISAREWASGFDEYCRAGFGWRSPHWLYDDWTYTYSFEQATGQPLDWEAIQAGGFANRYDHYLREGSRAGRVAHLLLDPSWYRAGSDAGAMADAEGAFDHYLRAIEAGGSEPRTSVYFDPAWYRQTYKDVAADISGVWLSALHHYLANETPTAFDPLPAFSEAFYRESQPDWAPAVDAGELRNFYQHFLANGVFELRAPQEGINLRAYVEGSARVRADLEAGVARDAFAHLLRFGAPEEVGPAPAVDVPGEEAAAQAVFRARAEALLPVFARRPIDFRSDAMPVISVIMAVHDHFPLTLQTLASLRDNFSGAMEVVVADCGSTDETRFLESYVLGLRVLRFGSNLGFLRGSNAALIQATADVVLYLNNDVVLGPGAVAGALARLASDERIGAVGAKIIRSHGRMGEAGAIIWRDGMTLGYMRDASPLAPEVNFVRDVDYCSAVFLLVRGEVVRTLEGFDHAFAPAYFEDTDLCVRLRQAGYRVVYDPAVVVWHLEYGSSEGIQPIEQVRASQLVFFRKHLSWLQDQPVKDDKARVFARSVGRAARRLLFIEDVVPLRMIGSGYTRSNDLVRAMVGLGWQVTVYPLAARAFDPLTVYADFPDTVEVMYDRSLGELEAFLQWRLGYYNTIWIARAHNLDRVKPMLERVVSATGLMPPCVLDTEAIVALREAERARVREGGAGPFDVDAAVLREFASAYFCKSIVTVNEHEAQTLRALGFSDVAVIGHVREVALTPRAWGERAGLLFIGAMHVMDSPNYDSLCWFVDEVLPIVEEALGWETRLTVIGYTGEGVTLERFRDHFRVTLRGAVANTQEAYDAHRVFIAPTRYAAGMPYKVHEAASFGVPVVVSELLRRQLGWENGRELLSADVTEPEVFARHIVALYRDEALWEAVRAAAAARVRAENDPEHYRTLVAEALSELSGSVPGATQ